MKRQLLKALEIAALTGDKIIVVDEKTDKGLVVMSLEDYEDFVLDSREYEEEFLPPTEWEGDWGDDDEIELPDVFSEDKFEDKKEENLDIPFVEEENNYIANEIVNEVLNETALAEEKIEESILNNIIEEPVEESAQEPLAEEPKIVASEPVSEFTAPDENENLYYYEEPSSAKATEGEPEEIKKEEGGFTSIQEEFKEKKKWEIPTAVKKGAEEIIDKN